MLDFIKLLDISQVSKLSEFIRVQTYSKGQTVFTVEDIPFSQFFIVESGSVHLKKQVIVEQSNFIRPGKDVFERRVNAFTADHILGTVHEKQYFGLLESLTDTVES